MLPSVWDWLAIIKGCVHGSVGSGTTTLNCFLLITLLATHALYGFILKLGLFMDSLLACRLVTGVPIMGPWFAPMGYVIACMGLLGGTMVVIFVVTGSLNGVPVVIEFCHKQM